MPRAPRRSTDVRNTAPLPSGRVPVGGPRLVVETPDIAPLAREAQALIEREQQRADQVVVLDADNQLARLETDIRTKASQRRGKDALGVRAEADELWRSGVGTIEQSLTNTRQQQAFRARAASRSTGLYDTLERHAANELSRFEDEIAKTAIDNRVSDAIANYTDAQAVAKAAVEARGIVRGLGKLNGWADDVTAARELATLSRIHAGVIARMLDNGDDRTATAWYRKSKAQITGEDQSKIDHALEQGSTLGEAQRQADAIIKRPGITQADAYERARAIPDPEVRRATEQQLDVEFARRGRAERDTHEALLASASEHVEQGRRPPLSIWSRLTQPEKSAADRRISQVVRGELVNTDWVRYYELRRMAGNPSTRKKFLEHDLMLDRPRLANSEFEELAKLQTSARSGDYALRGYLSDSQLVDATVTEAGLWPKAGQKGGEDDDKALAQFRQSIDVSIQRERDRTGKQNLSSADVQKIVDTEVLRVRFGRGEYGGDDDQGRRVVATQDIPADERNAIAAYLRSAGQTVSTSKIERMFAAMLQRQRSLYDQIAREP